MIPKTLKCYNSLLSKEMSILHKRDEKLAKKLTQEVKDKQRAKEKAQRLKA